MTKPKIGPIYKVHIFLLAVVVMLVSVGVVRRHTPLLSVPTAQAAEWDIKITSESSVEHGYWPENPDSYYDSINVTATYTKPHSSGDITAMLFVDGVYKGFEERYQPTDDPSLYLFHFPNVYIPREEHDFNSYSVQVKFYDGTYYEPHNGTPSGNMVLKDTDTEILAHPSDHYNIYVYGGSSSPQISHNENPDPDEDTLSGKFRIWVEDDDTVTVKTYVSSDWGTTYTLVNTHGISFQGPPAAYKTMAVGLTNLGTFEHNPNPILGAEKYDFKFELYDEENVLRATREIRVPHEVGECNDRTDNEDEDSSIDHPYDPECGPETSTGDWTGTSEGPVGTPSPSPSPSPSVSPSASPSASPSPSTLPSPSPGQGYCYYDENGDPIWCS